MTYQHNVAQRGDAMEFLHELPNECARLVVFDPQFRQGLDRLQYGNEGVERQRKRHALPSMDEKYIDTCCAEIARALMPSGYLMRWLDTFQLVQGLHRHIEPALISVSLIAWDSDRMGMGYRARHRGDYLVIQQKPPLRAKSTWRDHAIPDRWIERVDKKLHPHIKPVELIKRLIGSVTNPGDLIVDPCAGSFTVMWAALELGREFAGVDIAFRSEDSVRRAGKLGDAGRDLRSVQRGDAVTTTKIPSARVSDALSVTDGTTAVGNIVVRGSSFFAFGGDDVLIGEYATQKEAVRSIPTEDTRRECVLDRGNRLGRKSTASGWAARVRPREGKR